MQTYVIYKKLSADIACICLVSPPSSWFPFPCLAAGLAVAGSDSLCSAGLNTSPCNQVDQRQLGAGGRCSWSQLITARPAATQGNWKQGEGLGKHCKYNWYVLLYNTGPGVEWVQHLWPTSSSFQMLKSYYSFILRAFIILLHVHGILQYDNASFSTKRKHNQFVWNNHAFLNTEKYQL